MIALPLWQPWAQLVVVGAKSIETRSRAPHRSLVGQPIAVYATVSLPPGGKGGLAACVAMPHFDEVLRDVVLVHGAIVGTVVITDAAEMTAESIERLERENPREHAFGHYEPGRWAWSLTDPVAFAEPIEARPPRHVRGPFQWHGRDEPAVPVGVIAGQMSILDLL